MLTGECDGKANPTLEGRQQCWLSNMTYREAHTRDLKVESFAYYRLGWAG